MSELKVSQMQEATSVNKDDYLMIIQDGVNRKTKAKNVGTGEKTIIEDNLESASTINALSANQGRVLNEKITELNEEIGNRNTYSTTEEIKTGETWINGKPIYRKSFTFAIDASTHKNTIDVSDLNIELGLFDLNNSYINYTTISRYVPIIKTDISQRTTATARGEEQTGIYYKYGYKELVVETGNSVAGGVFVTIRYTKTTD